MSLMNYMCSKQWQQKEGESLEYIYQRLSNHYYGGGTGSTASWCPKIGKSISRGLEMDRPIAGGMPAGGGARLSF